MKQPLFFSSRKLDSCNAASFDDASFATRPSGHCKACYRTLLTGSKFVQSQSESVFPTSVASTRYLHRCGSKLSASA